MEISLDTRISGPSGSNWLPWLVSLAAHGLIVSGIITAIRLTPPASDLLSNRKEQTVFVDVEPAPEAPRHPPEPPLTAPHEPLHPVAAAHPVQPRPAPPAAHGSQIVDLPSANGEEPDANTPYIAEKASRVVREQRGKYGSPQNTGTGTVNTGQDTADSSKGIQPGKTESAPPGVRSPAVKPSSENQLLSLSDDLKPPLPGVAAIPPEQAGGGSVPMEKPKPVGPIASLTPARPGQAGNGTCPNPPCSQSVISSDIGATTDFLTGIETSGDITLLNAKSVAHAGFVRRVATNVFNQFIRDYRSRGWRIDPARLDDSLRVDAILGPDGSQETVFIRQSSGMKLWDEMGLEAMKKGAWDSNPPKGSLAADGKVHFVFIVNHRQGVLMAGIL